MNKGYLSHIDWGLLIPVLILTSISLVTLFSVNVDLFRSQLLFTFFSLFVFLIFTNSNYKAMQLFTLPVYVVSLVLLFIVLLLGIESRGAVRWIDLFGIRIQFSEILKPFLALVFSSFVARQSRTSFRGFFLVLGFILPVALFIMLQPDLGNAMIYLLVALLTLIAFGYPLWWFVIGGGGFLLMGPILWQFLHDYQKQRVLTFINPTSDPLGRSYNAIQSMIAVGSGGIFGKGFGEGTQSGLRFLPERHTDFIFATLSEQFGLIGGLLVIICFAFLLYRIYVVFNNVDDPFCKTFICCSFFLILIQCFLNIGMNVGIVPVVGVTLPFVSYGGSSLLSSFILLGLISSVSKNVSDVTSLEIR